MSTEQPLYGTARWRRLAERQLKAHPLCLMCMNEGQVTRATVCDHVEPHGGDQEAFWAGPFQSLCKRHHDSDKQIIEKGGKPKQAIGDDGWPKGS